MANAQGNYDLEDEIRNEGLDIESGGMGWFLDFDGEAWIGMQGWFEDVGMGRGLTVGDDHLTVRLGVADSTPDEVLAALVPLLRHGVSGRLRSSRRSCSNRCSVPVADERP